ncbi:MAG: hypothetical protein ACXVB1_00145 [Pseudobdellovibrionaceae bacterium]
MKDFEVITVKRGEPIDLREYNIGAEFKPVKLFIKPDGTFDNEPSYCFVLQNWRGDHYVAQISHKMLMDGMKAAEIAGNK